MKIRGEFYDNGKLCDLAPFYALIERDEHGLYDAEIGERLSIDECGYIVGWPCVYFNPDKADLERLQGLNAPA